MCDRRVLLLEDGINVSSVWRGGGVGGGNGHAWMPAMCLPWPGRTPGTDQALMDASPRPEQNTPQRLDGGADATPVAE